jgi:hypothetical protein
VDTELDLTQKHQQELGYIRDRYFFTSCWEFVEVLSTTGAREFPQVEDDLLLLSEVLAQPCPSTLKVLREALEALDDPDHGTLSEEEIESLEEEQYEIETRIEELEPREAMNFWVVSKQLAEHYAWREIEIDPPVVCLAGLWVWASFYTSITDDWFLEQLVEHICAQRLLRSSS